MDIRSLLIVLALTMPVAGCGVRGASPQATPRPAVTAATLLASPSPILPTTTPAPTAAQPMPSDSSESMATQVIDLVNAERGVAGCPPLMRDRTLAAIATAHNTAMAHDDFFDHTDPAGHSPFDRLSAAGYRYRLAAENIAAGPTTAAAVVAGWLASPGHRANILNCDLRATGVGYVIDPQDSLGYGSYWTQLFATPP